MPFDPKIINTHDSESDNFPEELELPEDLEALAEQLRDDASYLAQQHPAILVKDPQEHSSKVTAAVSLAEVRRSSFFLTGHYHRLLSGLAASIVLFMLYWGNHSPQQNIDLQQPIAEQRNSNIRSVSVPSRLSSLTDVKSQSDIADSITSRPLTIDDLYLRNFNDPQLEVVLDYLEQTKVKISPVSF